MLHKNNNLCENGPRRSAVWLALLSVAWLQLSSAAHELDHVAEQIGESCQVCLQLDRVDDVAADHSAAATLVPLFAAEILRPETEFSGQLFLLGFDPRAPPQI